MTTHPYAVWLPMHTGNHLVTFKTLDDAHQFIIKYGGGLEVIANTYETF